jgi:hypothetical protein
MTIEEPVARVGEPTALPRGDTRRAPRATEMTVVLVCAIISIIPQALAFAPIRDYRAGLMEAQFMAALLLDAYVILRVIIAMFRGTTWKHWKLVALICLTSPFWIHLLAMAIVDVTALMQYGQAIKWMQMLLLSSGLVLSALVTYAFLRLAEKRMRR